MARANSMRITTKTDYGLRVLIYLQRNKGKTKIQKIAEVYKISKNHLSVVVNQLAILGYIISTQGPNGGIEFNLQYADKTVAELVAAIEELEVVECFSEKKNTCNLSPHCKLKRILKKATDSFLNELKNYRIKDLV